MVEPNSGHRAVKVVLAEIWSPAATGIGLVALACTLKVSVVRPAAALRICRRWMRRPERFVQASTAALPFADEHFDAVLDIGCLHCADHDVVAPSLAEIRRVLSPGGRLFSRVFKPRSEAWLRDQRFEASRIGFSTEALHALFAAEFEVELWEQPNVVQVQASKRAAR